MWYVDTIGLVRSPRGLTINGIQHPRNIFTLWTAAELAAIGIKPASITSVDGRYSETGELTWNTDGETVVGTYATTDKNIASIKKDMKEEVQNLITSILTQSDWYAIREAEGGTAIPADWKTYRAAVRTMSNTKETEIDALADLDAVKAYQNHPVTYTRKTYDSDAETWGAPNVTSDTNVNLVNWTEEGDHAKSWPIAPNHDAHPSFVSVADA